MKDFVCFRPIHVVPSIVLFGAPHGLAEGDYLSFKGVKCDTCEHCKKVMNERSHRVVEVASPVVVAAN